MTNSTTPYYFPDDRYYEAQHHMWAKIDPDTGLVTIGLDALGLESMGDLVYMLLPEVGAEVQAGKPMGTMEAAKMTGDVISPISGTVVARNQNVLTDPYLANTDGYHAGWLLTLQPANWPAESATLIHGEALPGWVAAEIERYRAQGWLPNG